MSSPLSPTMHQILDRFDEAWNGPTPPRIEDYLAEVEPAARITLLVELVRIDLEHRLAAGEEVRLEEVYRKRFPELFADPQAIVALVKEELGFRLHNEPDLSPEEYLNRFPQFRDELLAQLPIEGLPVMSTPFAERMYQILDRFDKAWNGPTRPRIEDYLAEAESSQRLTLLIDLIGIDLERRLAAGEKVRVEENYGKRFPELFKDPKIIDALIKLEHEERSRAVLRQGLELLFRKKPVPSREENMNRFRPFGNELLAQPPVQPKGTGFEQLRDIGGEAFLESTLSTKDFCSGDEQPHERTDISNSEDATRVERLLDQIAVQSHFEERYELRNLLAKGGMGEIYRAYDRILRREVAIKMCRLELQGSEDAPIRGQFLKEARVGGRLLHPNVLAVFDLGVNRARQIYYTMRLVSGASLQHFLDSLVATKLVSYPLRKIVEAVVMACHGVDYAHQNGVIHLDLKPQNILISGFNEVFVIDWGLAKVDEVDDTEELVDLYRDPSGGRNTSSHTGYFGGRVVGTPGYMAPEQAAGDFQSFDSATDVFGLGGILFFVLYGKAPNQGQGMRDILEASHKPKERGRLRQEILPRGQRVSKSVQDAIEALEAICLKALDPDKSKRCEDVEKMIVELNEWLSNTPNLPIGI
jgi:predicted Ser/Thr protein kinase